VSDQADQGGTDRLSFQINLLSAEPVNKNIIHVIVFFVLIRFNEFFSDVVIYL
jgi:hypothetical protein